MTPYQFELTHFVRWIELAVQTPQEKNVRNLSTEESDPQIG